MQIVIDVPPEKEAEIRAKTQAAGYAEPSAYLLSLVDASTSDIDGYDADADEGPPAWRGRTEQELEELLISRAESTDAIEVTPAYWQSLRDEVERIAAAKVRA